MNSAPKFRHYLEALRAEFFPGPPRGMRPWLKKWKDRVEDTFRGAGGRDGP